MQLINIPNAHMLSSATHASIDRFNRPEGADTPFDVYQGFYNMIATALQMPTRRLERSLCDRGINKRSYEAICDLLRLCYDGACKSLETLAEITVLLNEYKERLSQALPRSGVKPYRDSNAVLQTLERDAKVFSLAEKLSVPPHIAEGLVSDKPGLKLRFINGERCQEAIQNMLNKIHANGIKLHSIFIEHCKFLLPDLTVFAESLEVLSVNRSEIANFPESVIFLKRLTYLELGGSYDARELPPGVRPLLKAWRSANITGSKNDPKNAAYNAIFPKIEHCRLNFTGALTDWEFTKRNAASIHWLKNGAIRDNDELDKTRVLILNADLADEKWFTVSIARLLLAAFCCSIIDCDSSLEEKSERTYASHIDRLKSALAKLDPDVKLEICNALKTEFENSPLSDEPHVRMTQFSRLGFSPFLKDGLGLAPNSSFASPRLNFLN